MIRKVIQIQCHVRKRAHVKRYKAIMRAILRLQSVWRECRNNLLEQRMAHTLAALAGKYGRRNVGVLRLRRGNVKRWAAALKIQNYWRAHRVAAHMGMHPNRQARYQAASVLIQSFWRAKMTRLALIPVRRARQGAARRIQACYHRSRVYKKLRLWNKAAAAIQYTWRERQFMQREKQYEQEFDARMSSYSITSYMTRISHGR